MRTIIGQSAIEFMIIAGVVIFMFLTYTFFIQSQIADKSYERRNLMTQEVAYTIRDEVNIALEATDGYSRTFKLPNTILNVDYNATIFGDSIYVRTLDGKHAIAIPIANVTGQLIIGDNTIRKSNGVIYLNS